MAKRGVLYIVWGHDGKTEAALERSLKSLKQWHPELPVEVCRVPDGGPVAGLQAKAAMADISPHEETLFLDADTVVMGRLDYGFEKARSFGLACCICEAPWARRYRNAIAGDAIEYNTGVLFWTQAALPVFRRWQDYADKLDSRLDFIDAAGLLRTMAYNDQASFAAAIEHEGVSPHVLPMNWNFRPAWQKAFFGPIRIWHDYAPPPGAIADLNRIYERGGVIQYHRMG